MNMHIMGAPNELSRDEYVSILGRRFYENWSKSRLVSAPNVYKLYRLDMLCNSWCGVDCDMLAMLWADYTLFLFSFIPVTDLPEITDPKSLRKTCLDEFKEKAIPGDDFISSPLDMKIQDFGVICHKMFLRQLGCPVEDISNDFYSELQSLYYYLYQETWYWFRNWRPKIAFEAMLRKLPNFEY